MEWREWLRKLDEYEKDIKVAKMRILFLDDSAERISGAKKKYANDDLTIVTNVADCLRKLSFEDWDVVSLDHDLGGRDFTDPDGKETGMEVVRYIKKTGWPLPLTPDFIVHSSNFFAANLMCSELSSMDILVHHIPFGWKRYQRGVIAGAFDVIHVGYVRLFKDAKNICNHLTILLHDKPRRVFSVEDRKEILLSMKGVDNVIVYKTEEELTELLNDGFDVRIVGKDHEGKSTRSDLNLETYYHQRDHGWSDTEFKGMIVDKYVKDG